MTEAEVIQTFKDAGALLEGHFIYASGRHGEQFLQAARVLQYPEATATLCKAMADQFRDDNIELVVGPATGGIILAYETARSLGCRGVFAEKEPDGSFAVKRGFAVKKGTRVLVVEDIVTTGGSVKKAISHLEGRGVEIVGVSVLIDRSAGKADFKYPYRPIARLNMQSWAPDEVPEVLAAKPVMEPDDLVL
ncbi:MAG: orotate phosphoribosyltransferase [Candidatus Hydrogenedentes bacterium]|nr:orotate phosphoribosyltransferase [Candidatus Hydrogenedentota bacterium]